MVGNISRIGLILGSFVIFAAIAELVLRVYVANSIGTDFLYYGIFPTRVEAIYLTRSDVKHHENSYVGYSKYYPHQHRIDYDRETGEVFDVGINNLGFRGTEIGKKAQGTTRIVNLGSSSTFGYSDRDNETYPHYLEKLLNEVCPQPVEVLNLGIPHLDSSGVVALLDGEVSALQPDLVTYYGGANDTANYRKTAPSIVEALRKRLLLAVFIENKLHPREPLDPDIIRKNYIENVSLIKAGVEDMGAVFVLANQQVKSGIVGPGAIKGVTYAQEVTAIEAQIKQIGYSPAANLLLHRDLMDDLRLWADESGTPFVDVIAALDNDRNTLVSWVHLSPRGNRIVARVFSDQILAEICPNQMALN